MQFGSLRISDEEARERLPLLTRRVWWYDGAESYHTSGVPMHPTRGFRTGTVADAIESGTHHRCEIGDCRDDAKPAAGLPELVAATR